MSSDEKLDKRLESYLDDADDDKKNGRTLKAVLAAQKEIFTKMGEYDLRIGNLETDLKQLKASALNVPPPFPNNQTQEEYIASLGPMRAELPSGLKLGTSEARIVDNLEESFKRSASMTPGPVTMVTATPEKLASDARTIIAAEFEHLEKERVIKEQATQLAIYREAEAKKKHDDEKEARDSKKRRRDTYASVIGGMILVILTAIGGLIMSGIRHEAGLAEGKALAPAAVPVPVPVYAAPAIATEAPKVPSK